MTRSTRRSRSTPVEPVADATWSSIAVSPAGAVMLGGVLTDGDGNYIPARSTLAADGLSFAPPVQTSLGYPWPEGDASARVLYSHADGSFHLVGAHRLRPGSSEIYHWVWTGVSWSGPDNLSQSVTDTWPSGEYAGSVAGLASLFVSWTEEGGDPAVILARTWSASGMTATVDVSHYFTDAGIMLGPRAWCLAADASPHMALGESAYQNLGVYILALPSLNLLFDDGFESGTTDAWSPAAP